MKVPTKGTNNNFLYLCLCLTLLHLCAAYQRIKDYKEYLQEWRKIVPKENIHDVSQLARESEQCYGKKCQFYYYQYADSSIMEVARRRTILMVSGMHGNQFLGPHTLLYAYQHLKAFRILYFPMANPSGFLSNRRQTFPSKIDPNRDYPIDSNHNCYQTSATFILDMLYRKYAIDCTIVLHNGGTQIGFNWGTVFHEKNSHTVQYPINMGIAEMMRKVGGKNDRLNEFKIGTMTQSIYPVSGTFDDWAYAAGKYPELITKCANHEYIPYPKNMTNGLVFLIEMGPFNSADFGTKKGIDLSPLSQSKHNGHVSRTIRVLKQFMHIFAPKLVFKWSQNISNLNIHVKGCSNATIDNLTIQKYQNSSWIFFNFMSIGRLNLQGNLMNSEPRLSKIQLNASQQLTIGDYIRYKGVLRCDSHWVGLGSTFFSTPRLYQLNEKISVQIQDQLYQIEDQSVMSAIRTITSSIYYDTVLQIAIVVCLVFFLAYIALRMRRKTELNRKIQKFEEAQQTETQKNFQDNGDGEMQGDLHTARGGIIQM